MRVTAPTFVLGLVLCSACESSPTRLPPPSQPDAGAGDTGEMLPKDTGLAPSDAGVTDLGTPPGDAGFTDTGAPNDITWYRDVVPVVQANCINCHRVGGIGPFSMESYATAAPMATAMAGAVMADYMPPWPASEDCQTHLDARTITDQEKAVIIRWADIGAPEGDPADAPPPPIIDALDRIDVEATSGADYTPSGEDDYRCFVVDLNLPQTEQLVALQILPGVSWMVHHVVLYQASVSQAQSADAADPGPGWQCFGGPGVTTASPFDSISVGAWAPGTPVTRYPAGTGIDLTPSSVIVMQVHYHLNGRSPEPDRTTLRMKFADAPLTQAYVTSVYDGSFAIPPGAAGQTYQSSATWPVTISGTVYGVFPHMHLLGRRITLTYRPPGGGPSVCLSEVPRWDFEWQQFYFYDQSNGIRVEIGGSLEITCEWARPTSGGTVYWGEGSNDEMCIVGIYSTL